MDEPRYMTSTMEKGDLLKAVDQDELTYVDGGGFWSDVWAAAEKHFWCGAAGIATSAALGPGVGLGVYAGCQSGRQ